MAEHDFLHTGVRNSQKVVALLDGDIVAVRSAAIFDSNDGHELSHLHMLVRKTISDWVDKLGADEYRICLSKGRCFRYDAYPQYKSNRTQPKPRGTDEAKEYLRNAYPIWEYDTLEADDVMGILATEPQEEEVRVIVSTDKDMLQIPAWQFNPDKDRWPHKPSVGAADTFLAYQWTCGDSGDGYPGIPGFGVARFKKEVWADALEAGAYDAFVRRNIPDKDVEAQRTCAAILRWHERPKDWDL